MISLCPEIPSLPMRSYKVVEYTKKKLQDRTHTRLFLLRWFRGCWCCFRHRVSIGWFRPLRFSKFSLVQISDEFEGFCVYFIMKWEGSHPGHPLVDGWVRRPVKFRRIYHGDWDVRIYLLSIMYLQRGNLLTIMHLQLAVIPLKTLLFCLRWEVFPGT